jgi:hypothetical protein
MSFVEEGNQGQREGFGQSQQGLDRRVCLALLNQAEHTGTESSPSGQLPLAQAQPRASLPNDVPQTLKRSVHDHFLSSSDLLNILNELTQESIYIELQRDCGYDR